MIEEIRKLLAELRTLDPQLAEAFERDLQTTAEASEATEDLLRQMIRNRRLAL